MIFIYFLFFLRRICPHFHPSSCPAWCPPAASSHFLPFQQPRILTTDPSLLPSPAQPSILWSNSNLKRLNIADRINTIILEKYCFQDFWFSVSVVQGGWERGHHCSLRGTNWWRDFELLDATTNVIMTNDHQGMYVFSVHLSYLLYGFSHCSRLIFLRWDKKYDVGTTRTRTTRKEHSGVFRVPPLSLSQICSHSSANVGQLFLFPLPSLMSTILTDLTL